MKSMLLRDGNQPGKYVTYRCISLAHNLARVLLVLGLTFTGLTAHADGNYEKHPFLDRDPETYENNAQIAALSAEDAKKLRANYAEALRDTSQNPQTKEQAENQLLLSLFAYDDVRVDIVNVIPMIIKDYDIQSPISKRLGDYGNRFRDVYAQRSSYVQSLQDYKGYDFQQGMSYASMLAVFYDDQALFDQLHNDMTNPRTSIGAYIDRLNVAYMDVEKSRLKLDKVIAVDEIKAVIDRIDENLQSRE